MGKRAALYDSSSADGLMVKPEAAHLRGSLAWPLLQLNMLLAVSNGGKPCLNGVLMALYGCRMGDGLVGSD